MALSESLETPQSPCSAAGMRMRMMWELDGGSALFLLLFFSISDSVIERLQDGGERSGDPLLTSRSPNDW